MSKMLSETELRGVAMWLRRLPGQFATPPGMPRDYVEFIEDNRLAKFHLWPSGHWQVTEAGWDFVAEYSEDRQ